MNKIRTYFLFLALSLSVILTKENEDYCDCSIIDLGKESKTELNKNYCLCYGAHSQKNGYIIYQISSSIKLNVNESILFNISSKKEAQYKENNSDFKPINYVVEESESETNIYTVVYTVAISVEENKFGYITLVNLPEMGKIKVKPVFSSYSSIVVTLIVFSLFVIAMVAIIIYIIIKCCFKNNDK